MRKREREDRTGEEREREREMERERVWRGREHTIIKASFLQRTIKSRPRRAAEHKSISFSRLQALRF